MTQEQIDRHRMICNRLVGFASDEFETGENFLASEMAWGAVAHYLKSVAKFRGWRNETHRDLNDIAMDLAYETVDPHRIIELYRSAGRLHTNFYEDWLYGRDVALGINDVEELIDTLEWRNRPPMENRPSQQRR